jgi:hypothetical protein
MKEWSRKGTYKVITYLPSLFSMGNNHSIHVSRIPFPTVRFLVRRLRFWGGGPSSLARRWRSGRAILGLIRAGFWAGQRGGSPTLTRPYGDVYSWISSNISLAQSQRPSDARDIASAASVRRPSPTRLGDFEILRRTYFRICALTHSGLICRSPLQASSARKRSTFSLQTTTNFNCSIPDLLKLRRKLTRLRAPWHSSSASTTM